MKEKLKKAFTISVIFMMLLLSFTSHAFASTTSTTDDLIFHEENKLIEGNNFTNLNDKIDELKELDEGTIIVRFSYNNPGDVMSLFSLSNRDLSNGHFHVYVTPDRKSTRLNSSHVSISY